MLIIDFSTNLCKVVPSVPERVGPTPQILIQIHPIDFMVVLKIRTIERDPFVAHVLLLYVVQDVGVVLIIETEEHLRVVQVAIILNFLAHRV